MQIQEKDELQQAIAGTQGQTTLKKMLPKLHRELVVCVGSFSPSPSCLPTAVMEPKGRSPRLTQGVESKCKLVFTRAPYGEDGPGTLIVLVFFVANWHQVADLMIT